MEENHSNKKFCKFCGAKIDADSRFCSICGKEQHLDSYGERTEEVQQDHGFGSRNDVPPPPPIGEPPRYDPPGEGHRASHGIGFIEAIRLFYTNFSNFKGRANRSEYWWVYLYNTLMGIVLSVIGLDGLSIIYTLIHLIPGIALFWRRCHDMGKSPWKIWIISCIPIFVGGAVVFFTIFSDLENMNMFRVASYISSIIELSKGISILFSIVQACIMIYYMSGASVGDNQWGPGPRPTERVYSVATWLCDCGQTSEYSVCPHCGMRREWVESSPMDIRCPRCNGKVERSFGVSTAKCDWCGHEFVVLEQNQMKK